MTNHWKQRPDDIGYKDPETLTQLYHVEGLSIGKIADKYGVGSGTVHYQMRKHGIQTRTANKDKPCCVFTDIKGYERGVSQKLQIGIHRLVMVAEYGIEAVKGMHVHHRNEIPWDNRPENLELMTNSEHMEYHNHARSE